MTFNRHVEHYIHTAAIINIISILEIRTIMYVCMYIHYKIQVYYIKYYVGYIIPQ